VKSSTSFPESPGQQLRQSAVQAGVLSPSLTPSAARTRVQKLRARLSELGRELVTVERLSRDVLRLVVELHEGWAWTALGFDTWEDLVEAEHLRMPTLPRAEESAAVRELLENHFSQEAVASVLGLTQPTVSRRKTALEREGAVFPRERRCLDGKIRVIDGEAGPVAADVVVPGQLVLPLPQAKAVSVDDAEAFLHGLDEDLPAPGVALISTRAALPAVREAAERFEVLAASVPAVSGRDQATLRSVVRELEGILAIFKAGAHSVGLAV
jgi:hypothetical protein